MKNLNLPKITLKDIINQVKGFGSESGLDLLLLAGPDMVAVKPITYYKLVKYLENTIERGNK